MNDLNVIRSLLRIKAASMPLMAIPKAQRTPEQQAALNNLAIEAIKLVGRLQQ